PPSALPRLDCFPIASTQEEDHAERAGQKQDARPIDPTRRADAPDPLTHRLGAPERPQEAERGERGHRLQALLPAPPAGTLGRLAPYQLLERAAHDERAEDAPEQDVRSSDREATTQPEPLVRVEDP